MSTNWASPTIFSQYSASGGETIDTAWDDSKNFIELTTTSFGGLQTDGTLYHISRSPKLDLKNKTYYLQCTGFNFTNFPTVVSGIEVNLIVNRYGRATDETISLCLGGNSIGANRAQSLIIPEIVYGSTTDLWSTNLTIANVQDPTFGIILRFQAHPDWPHNDPMLIEALTMRIS